MKQFRNLLLRLKNKKKKLAKQNSKSKNQKLMEFYDQVKPSTVSPITWYLRSVFGDYKKCLMLSQFQ
jgi:hypothetical protein